MRGRISPPVVPNTPAGVYPLRLWGGVSGAVKPTKEHPLKSKTMKAALAFLTASAAVVGFTGPTSAESIEGETYSYPLTQQGASGVTGNASATVNGTNLDVVVFADDIDFDGVVMHFHTGATCDAGGGIAVSVDGSTVPVIDGRFVYEVTVPRGTADMENVYFNVHEAGNLGNVLACGELALSDDPQVTPPETNSFAATGSAPNLNSTDITVSGQVSLQGNMLNVDLAYEGDDLLEGGRHLLMLRDTSSCTPGDFASITADIVLSVTRTGKTDAPDPAGSWVDIYTNSSWVPVAGAEDDPLTTEVDESTLDTLTVQTRVILSAAQAAALGNYSLVLLGSESEPDTSDANRRNGLTLQETHPSNCAQFVSSGTSTGGQLYNLDFVSYNASNIAGPGFLKNNANGAAGSVELLLLTSANSPTDGSAYKARLAAPDSMQCSADLAEQKSLPADNSDLGSGFNANNGVLRANLSNASGYTTTLSALNNDEYTIIITDNPATKVFACANMRAARLAPPETPEPPVAFSGTVAEATSIDEILAASDYRSNAENKGKDQEILRLYTAFFNRTPDVAGVKYWIAVSKGQEGPVANRRVYGTLELSGFFTGSTEFKTTFGSVSDADFVDTVYQNVLGRTGEPAGVAYWNDILNGTNLSGSNAALTKGTRAQVVYYVAINNEFINRLPYAPTT